MNYLNGRTELKFHITQQLIKAIIKSQFILSIIMSLDLSLFFHCYKTTTIFIQYQETLNSLIVGERVPKSVDLWLLFPYPHS